MHRFLGPPADDEGPIEHVVGLREGEALLGPLGQLNGPLRHRERLRGVLLSLAHD